VPVKLAFGRFGMVSAKHLFVRTPFEKRRRRGGPAARRLDHRSA
jgi:hypothetical protein